MKKLGVKACQEVMANIKVGDSIKANIAGCVENFQKRISKNGNKYAFVGLSDTTGNFEGMMSVSYTHLVSIGCLPFILC